MSDKLGMVELENQNTPSMGRNGLTYSEATANEIDQEVRRLTTEGYNTAMSIIAEYQDKHEAIAQALLEYETLDEKQILSLFETGHMPDEKPTSNNDSDEPMSYEEARDAANRKLTEDEDKAVSDEPKEISPDNDNEI